MELANSVLTFDLSSSDPNKQANALLSLLQQYSTGTDIQTYSQTSVLIKTSDPNIRKLCYQLLKGCSITNKYDWEFVLKVIVEDLNLKLASGNAEKLKMAEELCVWALRTIVALCGTTPRLISFVVKNRRAIEENVFRKSNPKIRIATLELLKSFGISLRKIDKITTSLTDADKNLPSDISSVEFFGSWLLASFQDTNSEVAAMAFQVLREMICPECAAYFHQERLPIRVSNDSFQWISFMSKQYSLLVTRLSQMDPKRRYYGLRPVAYIALHLQQQEGSKHSGLEQESFNLLNLMQPMLYSLDCATVMEGAHCLLLTSSDHQMPSSMSVCTNNYIDMAASAYLTLLDRDEASFSYSEIMKDVCAVVNVLRDKYTVCVKLIEHISKITNNESRVLLLSTIFKVVFEISLRNRLFYILHGSSHSHSPNNPTPTGSVSAGYNESEFEKFCKEPFISRCWTSPNNYAEAQIRSEMLYCMCREFFSLKPTNHGDEDESAEKIAWSTIGMEVSSFCKSCLVWNYAIGLQSGIASFGRVLTRLCLDNLQDAHLNRNQDSSKLVQRILEQILDTVPKMQNEFAEIISMCLLSNFILFQKNVSGQETVDVVFDHTRFMISSILKNGGFIHKQKIETLISCLLCICLRFSLKLQDTLNYFKSIIDTRVKKDAIFNCILSAYKKVEYAIKYNIANNMNNNPDLQILFGRAFYDAHPIFKTHFSKEEDDLVKNYIKGVQTMQDIYSRLFTEDPFQLQTEAKVAHHKLVVEPVSLNYSFSKIISRPSDPLIVTATYYLNPQNHSLLLHVKVHNPTSIDLYQVVVEIGIQGSVALFESVSQCTQIVGDLPSNQSHSFERAFLIDQFTLCKFFVSATCSNVKKTGDADLLKNDERKDVGLVSIRMEPFQIRLFDFLQSPVKLFQSDFLSLWELFPSSFHKKFSMKLPMNQNVEEIIDQIMLQSNRNKLKTFSKVQKEEHLEPQSAKQQCFELCYSTRTFFEDYILLIVFGSETVEQDCRRVVCDFEFKTTEIVMEELLNDKAIWFETEMVKSNLQQQYEIQILSEGSHERGELDLMSIAQDVPILDIKTSFALNDNQLGILHLKRYAQVRDEQKVGMTQVNGK